MAALRVADEMGEAVGASVGYHFRFEKVIGPNTRLKFLTEGMLLRLLAHDPTLSRVAAIVLDEFHERHLHTDIALAYLFNLHRTSRPDLKIICMSATIQTDALAAYLNNAPVIELNAPVHPVEIRYLAAPPADRVEGLVLQAVNTALQQFKGDILVFLPGMGDIRRSQEKLRGSLKKPATLLALHGELAREEQALVFEKAPNPKIILATNIAETSLTIPGVTTVIDSGLHRQASFSWWSGIPSLKTKPISQASAIQRAGRAGRTEPGQCFRLFTRSDFDGRLPFEAPEIRRSDLTQVILEIKNLGIKELSSFPWFEKPEDAALETACRVLFELGATESTRIDAALTSLGKKMATLPLNPRLARMLLEAEKRNVLEEAALLAALISEDELSELEIIHALEKFNLSHTASKLASQILSNFGKAPVRFQNSLSINAEQQKAIAYSLLTGFADRVAKKRKPIQGLDAELVFCRGGSAKVAHAGEVVNRDYFVILDVQESRGLKQSKNTLRVRSLCGLEPEWLFDQSPELLKETNEPVWEESGKKIVQISRINYGSLVLSESREEPDASNEKVARLFLEKGLGFNLEQEARLTLNDALQTLNRFFDPEPLENFFARLELLAQHDSTLSIPKLTGSDLARFLEKGVEGLTRLKGLETPDLLARLRGTLPPAVSAQMDSLLPLQVSLPSNRKTPVHYRLGQKPWIESRLQDFFKMREGPKIFNGRIALLIHLLAPNKRALQVTQDLESFWKNVYPQIRPGLCRRYPKHVWLEDPLGKK